MEVLFYQGLIVVTLVLVRIISPKHLLVACVIWTVLTLVNLFWPPLILLQLIVVWGTYNFIKPKESLSKSTGDDQGNVSIRPFSRSDAYPSADAMALVEGMIKARNASTAELPPRKAPESAQVSESESGRTSVSQQQGGLRTTEGRDATEIHAQVTELGIPHLVHFTRCENLQSIFRYGLHPVTNFHAKGIHAIRNDKIRLDGRPDGISLSVTFPNYRMFYKYRQLDVSADWAVLLLSNRILWEKECGYFKYNAADTRMRGLSRAQTMTLRALRDMFVDLDNPREHWLRPYDPSDPQAEVMVYDHIEPTLIETVAFETEEATDRWMHVLGGIDTIYAGKGKGLFGPRAQVRVC